MKRIILTALMTLLLMSACSSRDALEERDVVRGTGTVKTAAGDEKKTGGGKEDAMRTISEMTVTAKTQVMDEDELAELEEMVSKKESRETPSENEAEQEVSANGVTDGDEAESPDDEVMEALREGYGILVDTRDALYAYYLDESVEIDGDVVVGIGLADDLIERMNAEDISSLKSYQVAAYFDEMADIMDIFSRIKPAQDPKTIDILDMKEALKGTMWIDDDVNTYMFDNDGRTMRAAVAGNSTTFAGTYSISFTDSAIRFIFSVPQLKTEIKADVTRFTGEEFCFTDISTGDEFYLTLVK